MKEMEVMVGVAHEVKTPISIVQANLSLLKSKDIGIKYKENFDIMLKEIKKLDSITKEFFKFMEEKDKAHDIIYLKDLIETVIEDHTNYNNTNVNIIFNYTNSNIAVEGFHYHFYLVISNILKNSIDAINSDGTIQINLKEHDGIVNIEVEDDGIGLNKDSGTMIFEKFFTTKKNGTGLGITIIDSIIKMYKGDFYIRSGKHKGCIATIKLPMYID